jgi:putative colanic acid biosynthesis UDP-glucose lipid carrier transferase
MEHLMLQCDNFLAGPEAEAAPSEQGPDSEGAGILALQDYQRPIQCDVSVLVNPACKRTFDIIVASALLVLVAPLVLALSIIATLHFRGSPIFSQARTGLGGTVFTIYKLRSMAASEDGSSVRAVRRNDPRLTAFGTFVRRYSLDELPQLWNVIIGDMSLVGPRPHALLHDYYYGHRIPSYDLRFRMKPGITGLAQCSGWRGEIPELSYMAARVKCDNYYIDSWTLQSDLKILIATAFAFSEETAANRSAVRSLAAALSSAKHLTRDRRPARRDILH